MNIIKILKKEFGFYKSDDYIKELREAGASIGKDVIIYNPKMTYLDIWSAKFIKIGNNVKITEGCKILAHDYSYSVVANVYGEFLKPQKKTVIGNNVFLGMNSIILMGSTIGDNVIIGAGSIVSGEVESNSVYAGNPARKVCSLEQHYQKLKSKFKKSAQCHAKTILDKNGKVEISDMKIYKMFFLDYDEMKKYIENANFSGIYEEVRKNPKIDNKRYETIEELLKDE